MRPVIISFFLLAAFGSGQDVYLRLTDYGGGKINLVVERFTTRGTPSADQDLARQATTIEDVLKQDLEYALYFEIFTDTAQVVAGSEQGVVLNGSAEGESLAIHLADLETREKISERAYKIDTDLRKTAHIIADDVIKTLTGETGIAMTKIVFSYKTTQGKELGMVDYDGYNFVRLTNNGNINIFPSYAPDGNKILFSTYDKDRLSIYLYDLAKRQSEMVSSYRGLNFAPCWSPDGTKICMSLSKDGNPEIYMLDLNTKILTRLTRNSAIDTSPTFSLFGSPEPLAIFAACLRSTDAGGVLVIKEKDLSAYIVITTGMIVPV